MKFAVGRVTTSRYAILFCRGDDFRHRHFVARQRSRFVGTDHRDRTERFHAGQSANERVAFHHSLQTERERDRHYRG